MASKFTTIFNLYPIFHRVRKKISPRNKIKVLALLRGLFNRKFLFYKIANPYISKYLREFQILKDTEDKWIYRLGTFNPPNGLDTRDEIKTRCRVNFRIKKSKIYALNQKFAKHNVNLKIQLYKNVFFATYNLSFQHFY